MNWIERLARLGYMSIGAVYAIIGGMTAAAALHRGGKTADRRDAIAFILGKPFGHALLLVVAAGLAGYALWRLSSGIFDSDRRGSQLKGIAIRIGSFVRGLAYGAAALQVGKLALRQGGAGKSSDSSAKQWTARLMSHPFGRWATVIAGLIIIGAGVYQLSRAFRSKLSKRLDLRSMNAATREKVVAICRFGIAARGIVFTIIGGSVVLAAIRFDASRAQGTSGAFRTLAAQPFGRVLTGVVAVGFIAYGVYAFVNGRYRRIEA
ncbi:MAG: hypothetical protein QOI24_3763 [Acidobacteriota bacterium]|jgi:hypothetical protein|nr:hypothetical protein [Acidobacteriota bacterium]